MLVTDRSAPLPFEAIARTVEQRAAELVSIRRDLHTHPELGRGEVRTTALVAERLERAGIGVRRLRGTGLVADLGAPDPSHRIALRADIDALPIREQTGLAFASQTDGVSHSCGHDVHTTALLGAALALKARRGPARGSAASARVSSSSPPRSSCPEARRTSWPRTALVGVDRIFALHCDPNLDAGQVGLRVGAITAAADQIDVTLSGRGGHTSRPHLTQDLTYALAKVVTDVPAVLSRRLDPRAGAALVWGSIHSGGAHNVIPSLGPGRRHPPHARREHLGRRRAPPRGRRPRGRQAVCRAGRRARSPRACPRSSTTPAASTRSRQRSTGTGSFVAQTPQSLGGEDFAWYLTHVPGAMARLGTRAPGGPTYDLHRGDLVIDEGAIVVGARTLAGVVFSAAAQLAGTSTIAGVAPLGAVADR